MKKAGFLVVSTAVIGFVLIGIVAFGLFFFFAPVSPTANYQSFIVTKGDSLTSVAQKLTENGLLRTPWSLRLLVKFSGQNAVIQPGTYKLSPTMGPREVLTTLLSETQDVWVTLKEGWRVEEMADELDGKLRDGFDKAEFIQLAKPVEGHLFPDTYLLSKDMTAPAVFAKLAGEFEEKYTEASQEVTKPAFSKKDTVIVASLVEREGRGQVDTSIVAGILKNRLDAGMPLQVDATLQYASGYDQATQSWWSPPTSTDRQKDNAYNTYMHPGLPPTAICNPGLSSLKAALSPQLSDYLFYLHDSSGKAHYAKTFEEHKANIEAYLR
ncbi:MAG: endolytic transglycosylase MltG [Candidatus Woesebacteria bacterium]